MKVPSLALLLLYIPTTYHIHTIPCRPFSFGQGSRRPRFGRAVIVGPRVRLVTHKSSHPSLHLWLPVDPHSTLTLLPSFSTTRLCLQSSTPLILFIRNLNPRARSGTASRLGVAPPSCATMTKEDLSSDRINYLIWRHVFPLPYLVACFRWCGFQSGTILSLSLTPI